MAMWAKMERFTHNAMTSPKPPPRQGPDGPEENPQRAGKGIPGSKNSMCKAGMRKHMAADKRVC